MYTVDQIDTVLRIRRLSSLCQLTIMELLKKVAIDQEEMDAVIEIMLNLRIVEKISSHPDELFWTMSH